MKKRGQITLFIIVAILLLFSAALILYVRERITEVPKAQVGRMIEDVPSQFQPVQQYVIQCIDQVGRDALKRIGAHGGYIGTREEDMQYTQQVFKLDLAGMDATSADAITFNEDWDIPYWWHMNAPNTCRDDCTFESLMPALRKEDDPQKSVEAQMERYIQAQIGECLGDFRVFRRQNIIVTPSGSPRVYVTIARKDLLVSLEYPLLVEVDGSKQEVRYFTHVFDVNLQKVFDLAWEITKVESSEHFLEHDILGLIAAYQGYGTEDLPPMAGATVGQFVATRWLRTNVKEKLQRIIGQHSEAIQVLNTRNYNYITFGEGLRNLRSSSLYAKKSIWLNTTKLFWDYDVNAVYMPHWPIYFYIMPGEIITARDGGASFISILPIPYQRYDLPYDVSVPYLFEVRDDYALNDEGFSLYFALEGNVRNNLPLKSDSIMIKSVSSPGGAQLCNPEHRISGDYTITVHDSTGRPVPEVLIQIAASEEGCPMGQTNAQGIWKGKFPTGVMGNLIVGKPGYSSKVVEYFMPQEEDREIDIMLYKAINVSVVGIKRNVNKIVVAYDDAGDPIYDWVFNPGPLPLMDNEEMIILVQRDQGHPREQTFAASTTIRGSEVGHMLLIPGNYSLNVILLKKDTEIVIPEDGDVPEIRLAPSEPAIDTETPRVPTEYEAEATSVIGADSDRARAFQEQAEAEWADPDSGARDYYEENYGNEGFPTGTYELRVEIGNEIYSPLMDDMSLGISAINWNIVDVPQRLRTVDDMTAYGMLQEYVTNYSGVFQPVLTR